MLEAPRKQGIAFELEERTLNRGERQREGLQQL
jgi:hypothetical protein